MKLERADLGAESLTDWCHNGREKTGVRVVAELKNESLIANENGIRWRILLRLTARLYELLLLPAGFFSSKSLFKLMTLEKV